MIENKIEDKEIEGLPSSHEEIEVPTTRLGSSHDIGLLCLKECESAVNSVKVYDLLELFAAVDFYKRITEHPEIMALLPESKVLGPYQIDETRQKYFAGKNIIIPEKNSDEYAAFAQTNPEDVFFDFLRKEWQLTQTYNKSDKRPQTTEEHDKRMKEVLPDMCYIEIKCCDEHHEATIRHTINGTWYRYISHDIEAEGPVEQRVWNNSLIYAPNRIEEPKVILSAKIADELLPRAEQTRDIFYETVAQLPNQKKK